MWRRRKKLTYRQPQPPDLPNIPKSPVHDHSRRSENFCASGHEPPEAGGGEVGRLRDEHDFAGAVGVGEVGGGGGGGGGGGCGDHLGGWGVGGLEGSFFWGGGEWKGIEGEE